MWVYTRIIRPMGRNLIDQRYELRTLVGSGGMADVYLAVDEVLGREVALKLLKDRYAETRSSSNASGERPRAPRP